MARIRGPHKPDPRPSVAPAANPAHVRRAFWVRRAGYWLWHVAEGGAPTDLTLCGLELRAGAQIDVAGSFIPDISQACPACTALALGIAP